MAEAASGAIRSGYRWELDRAIRTNNYLRVFFSTGLLIYCGFGPGLLIRFPVSIGGVTLETIKVYIEAFVDSALSLGAMVQP